MIILFINIQVSTMYQELLLVMSKTDLDSQPSWNPHSTEEKLDWYPSIWVRWGKKLPQVIYFTLFSF